MSAPVLVISGSTRRDSLNQHLARAAVRAASARGRDAEYVDLDEYPMPMYHGDLEGAHGPPDAAARLHDRLAGAGGLLVASPEYNGAMTPLLKNTVDWITRIDLTVLRGPLIGLLGASPGRRGASHGLGMVRTWFEYMGLDLLDEPFSLPRAHQALRTVDGSAQLDEATSRRLGDFVDRYLAALDAHHADA